MPRPAFVAIFALSLAMAGCAVIEDNEARQQQIWLKKAGFHVTAQASGDSKESPPRGFWESVRPDGTVTYYYADPTSGAVYSGEGLQMETYRKIVMRDRARRAANLARMTPGSTRYRGPTVW